MTGTGEKNGKKQANNVLTSHSDIISVLAQGCHISVKFQLHEQVIIVT